VEVEVSSHCHLNNEEGVSTTSVYMNEKMMVKGFNNGCLFPFWITMMNVQLCVSHAGRSPTSSHFIHNKFFQILSISFNG
jgi:hypothetical protein